MLAEEGCILLTGGLDGVMAEAARGATEAGGLVLGLLPGTDATAGNRWLTIALPTGLGELRNLMVVAAAEAVVAVGGSWGTLSEVALACRLGIPVVVLGEGWQVLDQAGRIPRGGPVTVADPAGAVAYVLGRPRRPNPNPAAAKPAAPPRRNRADARGAADG